MPCVFDHETREIKAVIHGDDFTLLGQEVRLNWFRGKIQERFEVNFLGRIGPGLQDEINQVAQSSFRMDRERHNNGGGSMTCGNHG